MAMLHRPIDKIDPRGLRAEPAVHAASSHGIVHPVEEDRFWQRYFRTEPYHDPQLTYDDYGPAYRLGIAHRLGGDGRRRWNDCEADLIALWERRKGYSRLDWARASNAVRAAWNRIDNALAWPH